MAMEPRLTRREGRCFWLREAIAPGEEDAPGLEGERHADIGIVGGGMTGLWTAIELKRRQPSLDVAILEADICGGGASGRNSGMVLPLWMKFQALEPLCGAAGAIGLCRASEATIDMIESLCRSGRIDAQLRRDGWIWGAACEQERGRWDGVIAALARHGLHPFNPVSREEIEALAGTSSLLAGVHARDAATVHPGRLVRGLRRLALEAGVHIYENAPMTALQRGSPPAVRTARGVLRADRLVLAMNAWSLRVPELRPAILVIASDDAVSEPAAEMLDRARYRAGPLITDSRIFVTGFRTTPDGRVAGGVTGGRVGFGSLDGARFEGRSARDGEIRDALRRLHPRLADLPFADSWCGPIDRTRSGLPLFGALPDAPDILYGYGFSGNGIATTPLAGRILASLALGEKDEWSGCGLVRPVDRWMPPEPLRYLGALAVRAAVGRKDRLAHAGRAPGPITRRLAALAPGGVVTTPADAGLPPS